MKNKILILISLVSFPSFINALSYEVRGIERESQMFGDAICVSLYIINNSRNIHLIFLQLMQKVMDSQQLHLYLQAKSQILIQIKI